MFAFVAVFAYSGYASLRRKNPNGKLGLPQSHFIDAIMSLWIFCATIAIAVGIPMLIYYRGLCKTILGRIARML